MLKLFGNKGFDEGNSGKFFHSRSHWFLSWKLATFVFSDHAAVSAVASAAATQGADSCFPSALDLKKREKSMYLSRKITEQNVFIGES